MEKAEFRIVYADRLIHPTSSPPTTMRESVRKNAVARHSARDSFMMWQ